METDNNQIQALAVKVVEAFINDKQPLNEGIVKCATELDLNSNQLQRVVEAANSIAYLKLLGNSSDRTFEFPLGNYKECMAMITLPKIIINTDKPEECHTPSGDGKSINKNDIGMNKEHIHEELGEKQASTKEELHAMLMCAIHDNRSKLEKVAMDKHSVCMGIEDCVKFLRKDPLGLEKLAEVSAEEEYNVLSKFFPEKKAQENLVFEDRELLQARELVSLYKQASELVAEEIKRKDLEKRALSVIGHAIKGTGHAITGAIGLAAAGVAGAAKAAHKIIPGGAISGGLAASAIKPSKPDVWSQLHG